MNLLLLHKISVWLFVLIYLIKTFLLFTDRNETLGRFSKIVKVPEMIVSTAFLLTGIYLFYLIGGIKLFQIFKLIAVVAAIPIAIVGFKKHNKMLAGLSMVLILLAYGFAEMARKKSYLGTGEIEMVNGKPNGQSVYLNNCVSCHGADGAKGYNGATNLKTSSIDATVVQEIIKNGKGAMMPFGSNLSEEEMSAVTEYVLTLR